MGEEGLAVGPHSARRSLLAGMERDIEPRESHDGQDAVPVGHHGGQWRPIRFAQDTTLHLSLAPDEVGRMLIAGGDFDGKVVFLIHNKAAVFAHTHITIADADGAPRLSLAWIWLFMNRSLLTFADQTLCSLHGADLRDAKGHKVGHMRIRISHNQVLISARISLLFGLHMTQACRAFSNSRPPDPSN